MLNQTELISLKKGSDLDHYLLVKKAEIRLARNNKSYFALELGDQTLSLNAFMWDNFEVIQGLVSPGIIVKVTGILDEFQGASQIKISKIRCANSRDNVSPFDFLSKSKRDLAEMQGEFWDRIDRIRNKYLQRLLNQIFNEETFNKFSMAPAGKSWHHSYLHGLLEHTLELIRICDLIADIHVDLNRDLLISGTILHDLGKIEELSFEKTFEYTDKGKLIGHIVIAALIINEAAAKITGFPEDLKTCLIHIVLSHQGKLEYASPVVPKIPEAIALYQADELSAKVNAYRGSINSEARNDSKWTKYISLIATDLFSHGITENPDQKYPETLFDENIK